MSIAERGKTTLNPNRSPKFNEVVPSVMTQTFNHTREYVDKKPNLNDSLFE